jgi:beta-lactamase class C
MHIGIENPAGGLKSNTYDLAKYLQLQISPQSPKFQQALAIVHKNYYCLYEDGTYQQLTWEYHPTSDLFKKFMPDNKNRNITSAHKLPSNCQNMANGFIDKTGNSSGMTSYIAYSPNKKVGVVILSNNALKPDVVDLGRYILQKTAKISK